MVDIKYLFYLVLQCINKNGTPREKKTNIVSVFMYILSVFVNIASVYTCKLGVCDMTVSDRGRFKCLHNLLFEEIL